MKKVFDQTVRDLKREVNKKVLKVPGIEQKVLDSTSNEPWGPHGSLLADIAAATRNYHEYQIIMTVIWKRISDTGKNWRHVYKGLVLLEYLVANGSERVIDEIREHVYQISTLSEFQYIDSSGRDQGINVRRKSQSLVALVNDKESIIEVRQKAAANREKFRNISAGGMYRPGSYSGAGGFDDDRYEGRNISRDEDRNGYGYGREKEWDYKDDDRHGRYSDPYSRDGDRYGRDYEDRYGRDGYREDEFQGRSHSVDNYRHGSRSRSSDRDREHSFDDDGQYSSRGSGARADEYSQDGRRMERKFSEQNLGAPPSYEEAVSETRSPVYSERDAEATEASAPTSSPPVNNQPAPSPSSNNHPSASLHERNHPASSPTNHHPSQENSAHGFTASPVKNEVEAADEFDPRVPVSAIPVTNNAEMDLIGSLSDSFVSNSLAVAPSKSPYATSEVETHVNSGSTPTFAAASPPSSNFSQAFEDPFGDGPFKAIPSTDATQAQPQTSISADSLQPGMNQIVEPIHGVQKADTGSNFEFADALSGLTYSTSDMYSVQSPTSLQSLPQQLSYSQQDIDILADILPPSCPMPAIPSQTAISGPGAQLGQSGGNNFGTYEVNPGAIVPANTVPQTQSGSASQQSGGNYLPYVGSTVPGTSYMAPQTSSGPTAYFKNGNFVPQQVGFTAPTSGNFYSQQGFTAPNHGNYYSQGGSQRGNQSMVGPPSQFSGGIFLPHQGFSAGVSPQVAHQAPTGLPSQHSNNILGNIASQTSQQKALPSSSGSLAAVGQPAKDKFEPKSAVWADTLSRGLVNLNISGPKTNPMADIGVDFDAINRKEKRMEKQPAQAPVTSTVNMGKAMGTGSGLGRAGAGAGAGALRPQANIMMGSVPGGGMSIGGYGGMIQPMGGMGVNPGMGMGMGMNPGMGQRVPMQMPSGLPPSSNMSGYNPMMGPGGYGQQPYGGHQ